MSETPKPSPSRRRRRLGILAASLATVATVALLAGEAGSAITGARSAQAMPHEIAPVAAATATPASFADMISHVGSAVVSIEVTSTGTPIPAAGPDFRSNPQFRDFFEHFFGNEGPGEHFFEWQPGTPRQMPPMKGAGSGFIVDPDGYVVTNYHVVDGAQDIQVKLLDGSHYKASVVGTDNKTDLAVLKVDAKAPLPAVRFGDSSTMRVGDWVVAVGNPFGLGHTATVGVISAKGRDINSGPYDDYIQVDAPINRGNSGGPLFNAQGEVIGVNTAIFSPSGGNVGIGFAIPASMASDVVADLKADGHIERGWLGVVIQDVTDDMAQSLDLDDSKGAIVSDLVEDSPAEHAGLQQGDVITAVNGKPIKEVHDLTRAVAKLTAGETAKFTLWRDGRPMDVDVIIASAPDSGGGQVLAHGDSLLGMRLSSLDQGAREHFGLDEGTRGVVVTQVEPAGAAAQKGIQPGDVIVSVGNDRVSTPADVVDGVREAKAKEHETVLLLVERDGQDRYIGVPVERG